MKKNSQLRRLTVGVLSIVCTLFPTFQADAQNKYQVRFVLDGITKENVTDIANIQFYYSDDERLVSYEDPTKQRDLSYMPSATEVGFKYSKANILSSAEGEYAATPLTLINNSSNKIYFRYYSPQFTDVQTGSAELEADKANVVYLHPLENKKIVKVDTVKGRNGKEIDNYVFFANTEKAIYSTGSGRICNGIEHNKTAASSFYIFAEKGKDLHYAIKPSTTDCALAVCTLAVTNDDTPQSIQIDYSKAKMLRLYVADSKGNYVKMDNPQLLNTYYSDQSSNYGWGTLYGGMKLDYKVNEAADGSYNWIETYALPGSEQNFEIYNVYSWTTADPDFLFPFNCPTPYLVKEVAVTENDEPQEVVMGKSDPRDVTFRLKGAAPLANVLDLQTKAFYHFKWYPFPEDRQWDLARSKETFRTTDGNDLIIHLKVSGVTPHLCIEPKVKNGLEYNDILWKANAVTYKEEFDLPEEGTYTNQTVMDYSKVHAVKFVARHGFLKKNMVALHADCFEYDNSFTHCIEGHKTDNEAIDTITVYLSEGNYEWYTISSTTGATTSKKQAFQVGSAANQTIIVDAVLTDVLPIKEAGKAAQPEGVFTLDGKRISVPQRGVNLIRMTDGTIKKIIK